MTAPMNSPLTGEIWHLSIDDLLAPLPEIPRLGGPGPFVINLSASTAPIGLPKADFLGSPAIQVYQIQRIEDRRVRYRLRLGPFASEDAAHAVLEKARDVYPGALTATADADDLRAIAAMEARESDKATLQKPPEMADTTVPGDVETSAVELIAGVPTLEVSTAVARRSTVPAAIDTGTKLETTQTLRPLTPPELQDGQALRWYIIQLSVGEEAFDPETLPDLDIFGVYRLYSVASIDQGRIMHSLRLGFFSEEIAAAAVASYLGAYYEKPGVKRVSVAERERFANQRLEPRKNVGATAGHAIIEITSERYVREKRGGGTAAVAAISGSVSGKHPTLPRK